MAPLIFEELHIEYITPFDMDDMLAEGWRHFGTYFFRYNMNIYKGQLCNVIPLRVDLEGFDFTKSQKKILRRNSNFTSKIQPIKITEEQKILFEHHKEKFTEGVPGSLNDFLSHSPDSVPGKANELLVYDGDKLIAVSYFDIARSSISSIYGMFDLDYHKHSLGIYTMLLEIEFAKSMGLKYYYHGYCYDVSSFYDYKKRFNSMEYFDWQDHWHTYLPK
ncbi:MAG: arginine-tRNA-protein transferase [Thalassobius sp.]|nr:arginine-tRNA-protein transferase [Thalassovita sp.]